MTENQNIIIKFFTALSNANTSLLYECFHPEIQFRDPVFGILKAPTVCLMWETLIKKNTGNIKIEYSNIKADNYLGSGYWITTDHFSKVKKIVVNSISSKFHFKEYLILKHNDNFDIRKRSKQALGLKGLLFGWTGFFQKKTQKKALQSLKI